MSLTKVVILNWNGRAHLRKFLPSVLRTTPADVGIVVADNGSTDDSVAILEAEFPQVDILRLDRNYGYAEGYNRAIDAIEADYYILLNSDVETTAGWCEPLIAALDADAKLIAVQPKIKSYLQQDHFEYAGASGGFIDALGYPFCRGRILSTLEPDAGQYDQYRTCFWASGACFACKRELFTVVGGFDGEFFAHMEEIDLCWRAQLFGYKVAVEPAGEVYHLGGGTLPVNSPRKVFLNYRNNLAMLYKNLPSSTLWGVLLCRMILDGFSALVFLLQGHADYFQQVIAAHRSFYRWLPTLRARRATIQQHTVATPEGIYHGSIVLRYLLGRKQFVNLM